MISFEDVGRFTEPLPGIYTKNELKRLYDVVVSVPDGATVVEIGVLYGRSASVFLQVAKAGKPLDLHLVDPWVVSQGDTYMTFHRMVDQNFRDVQFTMHNCKSEDVEFDNMVDLLHVDGDHSPNGIVGDCDEWLMLVADGGVVFFHDYATRNLDGSLMYPQIEETVDAYCTPMQGWSRMGVVDSQAAYKRLPGSEG